MSKDIFISYSFADSQWAKWIAATLERNDFSVFIDVSINPGDDFVITVNEAIQSADVFMPILSESYKKSVYCTAEFSMAFGKSASKNLKLIPIRISNTTPTKMFGNALYIDLYNFLNEADAERYLLNALGERKISRNLHDYSKVIRFYDIEYPGSFPDNNLPSRNEYFNGRDEHIVAIFNLFMRKNNAVVNICQTIAGLGGIGKTQIAIEYAYRYGRNYKNCVWFIASENQTTINKYFMDFAKHFKITLSPDSEPENLQQTIKNWFNEHSDWLLIFDNLENFVDIEPYLPNSNNGHLIITTRKDSIGVGAKLGLDVFNMEEALEFLQKRIVGYGKKELNFTDFNEMAPVLVDRLGYLPLALEQAAAYIVKVKCSISTYLKYIEESDFEVFDGENAKPERYEAIVNTTWKLSMETLPQESEWLFNLCVYMAPERIPVALFKRNNDLFPEPLKSKLKYENTANRMLTDLFQCSLVSGNNEFINIHPLIQEQGRFAFKDTLEWLDICLQIFLSDIPREFYDWESKVWFDCIAKHAYSVVNYAYSAFDNYSTKMNSISELYFHLGLGFHELLQYDRALECYQKTLIINEKMLGENHPDIFKIYDNIAKVYQNMGNYSEALEWLQKSLKIRLKITSENDLSFVNTYNNFGSIYSEQVNYSKALEYYQKAMVISQNIIGFEHPVTAMTYNNIALVYSHLGDYHNALKWYHKELAIQEKIFGTFHLFTATVYNDMAIAYQNQGKNDIALKYYHKSLAINEKLLSKETISAIKIREKITALEDLQNNTNNNKIRDTIKISSLFVDPFVSISKNLPDVKINEFYKWYKSLPTDAKINDTNASMFRIFLTNFQSSINKIKVLSEFSPDDRNSPELCQYTRLNTLKFLVKAKTEDVEIPIPKFRLSNVAYLNDSSEGQVFIDLLNKYCSQKKNALFTEVFGVTSSTQIDQPLAELHLNNVYIGSFSKAKNILPMWTLYGDNSNGCCMVFDDSFFITPENQSDLQEIKLHKVHYYNTKNLCQINDEDEIIRSLRVIATSIEQWYKIIKINPELLRWIIGKLDEIRFLFKCDDYKYEDEVRLILRDDNVNRPFIDRTTDVPKLFINVNNPVVFKEVILGAKVENPSALAQFLLFAGVKKVTLSGITFR